MIGPRFAGHNSGGEMVVDEAFKTYTAETGNDDSIFILDESLEEEGNYVIISGSGSSEYEIIIETDEGSESTFKQLDEDTFHVGTTETFIKAIYEGDDEWSLEPSENIGDE